uniref:Receptor expression-enhancing protein n=1 Tax=Fibrocapsa japonica TaxID=94617 RepID=A0A7S2XXQ2_9STRA|mmetsp:Transcript_19919/g.28825  ORF Transcript_19919/g.28825 Transcript_19919/m.28825 type:complete len:165 (+) Transcript_19919:126-620(+)|eukprot:CAMPEP_0113934152 /NCGR_PEP_ID=MMETSP1339-20121228/1480_1 /TAXON_ID=94617 /ORGANISM="Fibrocapsa japonica" /LENGTH=164 /DNA_ID=CAMNT_0000935825 /DNA_START=96 /DNA_END=590 /DNA_ORIENTATION=+ /assembly_acc=CAM_ASM_000762
MIELLTEPLIHIILSTWCPYKSFKAIQSPTPDDDKQWLTFWVVYCLMSTLETVVDRIAFLVPFYYEIKFVIYMWLIFLGGATWVYDRLEPLLEKLEDSMEKQLDNLPPELKDEFNKVGSAEWMKKAAANSSEYISKYGKDAYETAMAMAIKQSVDSADTSKKTK